MSAAALAGSAGQARPAARIALLAGAVALCGLLFMTLGVRGSWDFVLQYRGTKLAAMVLVACAVGVSTVLFQTITHNRILTPSIMGFDALYVLIQTLLVFGLGQHAATAIDPTLKFAAQVVVMSALAVLLFRALFAGNAASLHLMLLVGVVLGVLLRSLTSFLLRLIDPNEFLVLQDRLFASFNLVAQHLVAVSAVTVAVACSAVWRMLPTLDALALGRDLAVNLGIDYRRQVLKVLLIVAVLVSVSTALVGPVTFLGLLVANLAYQVVGTHRHRCTLPAAALLGVLLLVGGQLVLERGLGYDGALSVVIEFVGGLVFIALLMRGGRR